MADASILESIVVEISRNGEAGCGDRFFISEREIVTCYHVLVDNAGELADKYWVRHSSWPAWQECRPRKEIVIRLQTMSPLYFYG